MRLRFQDGDLDLTSLQLKEDGKGITQREKLENCVNTNFLWAISHFIVLTCIVSAANSNPDSLNYTITQLNFISTTTDNFAKFLGLSENRKMRNQSDINLSRVQSDLFSRRPGLVENENLPLLNGLYVGIFSAMAINGILFYVQIWKPMVEEENLIVEEEKPVVEERGSTTATVNPRQGDEGER